MLGRSLILNQSRTRTKWMSCCHCVWNRRWLKPSPTPRTPPAPPRRLTDASYSTGWRKNMWNICVSCLSSNCDSFELWWVWGQHFQDQGKSQWYWWLRPRPGKSSLRPSPRPDQFFVLSCSWSQGQSSRTPLLALEMISSDHCSEGCSCWTLEHSGRLHFLT